MRKTIFFFLTAILPLVALEVEELTWENQEGPSAQEFNAYLQRAITEQNWWVVVEYADILSYHFPSSPFAQDAAYIIGEAYLSLNRPFQANEYFSAYLNTQASPRRFEEAINHKFQIAERFAKGEKKPLFNDHGPKWLSAKEDAVEIYEQVIATLPHSELAAKSMLSKAKIQAELEDFRPSLETLDLLIRRFPKHELAAAAYLEKIQVYYLQCQGRSLDPDLLDLANVTLKKFRLVFPREPKIQEAQMTIHKMEEAFAQNLLTTGSFFQKTKKIPAAKIYYKKAIAKYPNTEAANTAKEKLAKLGDRV